MALFSKAAQDAVQDFLNSPAAAKLINKAKIQTYAHRITGVKNSIASMRAKLNSLPLAIQQLEDELETRTNEAEEFKRNIGA